VKIAFEVYHDHVVNALCVAARDDDWLTNGNVSKPRIKEIVTEVIKRHGTEFDGWDDDLSEVRAAVINGWAVAQANRYTW
jgi:hypothetical protein